MAGHTPDLGRRPARSARGTFSASAAMQGAGAHKDIMGFAQASGAGPMRYLEPPGRDVPPRLLGSAVDIFLVLHYKLQRTQSF